MQVKTEYTIPAKTCRLLPCLFAVLLPLCTILAQSGKAPVITKTEERTYKLVQLRNGDLLPLVKQGLDNKDTYFENGRPIKEFEFNSFDELRSTKVYSYFGDSLMVVKTFDKNGRPEEADSVFNPDGKNSRYLHYLYRSRDTVVTIKTYIGIDSQTTRLKIQKTGEPDRTKLIKTLSNNQYINSEMDDAGNILRTDTITHHSYANGKKTRTDFVSGSRHNYTWYEYEKDSFNNWTSVMIFYNKDTIGDHIECVLRRIVYGADSAAAAFTKESLYGYWVMVAGMRYWYFRKDGRVNMYRRPSADTFYTKNWGFDEKRRQAYIELSAAELEDTEGMDVVGNRVYLVWDARRQTLTMGNFTCGKRPVLQRVKE